MYIWFTDISAQDKSAPIEKRSTKGRWYKKAQGNWAQYKGAQVKRAQVKEHSAEERWIKLN